MNESGDATERVARVTERLRAWIAVTPPAAFRLFWRAGDEAPLCPLCGGIPRDPNAWLGVYSPDPRVRARLSAHGGGDPDALLDAPADPGEAWFVVCGPCAAAHRGRPARQRLRLAQGERVRALLRPAHA
jgi:hypothetical protein